MELETHDKMFKQKRCSSNYSLPPPPLLQQVQQKRMIITSYEPLQVLCSILCKPVFIIFIICVFFSEWIGTRNAVTIMVTPVLSKSSSSSSLSSSVTTTTILIKDLPLEAAVLSSSSNFVSSTKIHNKRKSTLESWDNIEVQPLDIDESSGYKLSTEFHHNEKENKGSEFFGQVYSDYDLLPTIFDSSEEEVDDDRKATTTTRTTNLPRVAVCIRGDDRGVDNGYNIYKSIIEPLGQADVFPVIHTEGGNNNNNNNNNLTSSTTTIVVPFLVQGLMNVTTSQYNKVNIVDYDYKKYSSSEILDELVTQGMDYEFWYNRNKHYRETNNNFNSLGPIYTHGAGFYQVKDLFTCHTLITKNEIKRQQKYDYIVIVRSDHWCLRNPFQELSKILNNNVTDDPDNDNNRNRTVFNRKEDTYGDNIIYIPSGEDFGGTNDRLIALPRKYATTFLTYPYYNLVKNENSYWYRSNMESLVNSTLQHVIDHSGNDDDHHHSENHHNMTLSNTITESRAQVCRTTPVCFLSCKAATKYKSIRQGNDSWQACLPVERIRYTSLIRFLQKKERFYYNGTNQFATGYNGYKYLNEYLVALENGKEE